MGRDRAVAVDVGEFARILGIGLGRAVLLLSRHPADPYRDAILHACLHNTAYDPQVEGSRSEYILDIVGLTGDEGWYRERILEAVGALSPDSDYRDIEHLLDLTAQLARRGDADTREVLYRHFLASTAAGNDTGARQIVEVDGLEGFLFVADRLVAVAEEESEVEDFWEGDDMLRLVEDRLGQEPTAAAVDRAAAENPRVAEYAAAIRAYRTWDAERKGASSQPDIDYRELSVSLRPIMHQRFATKMHHRFAAKVHRPVR